MKTLETMIGALAILLAGFGASQAKEYNWGAISVDFSDLGNDPYYGIGGGDTKDEAVSNAQKFCREAGGKSCQSVTTYEACGSVATSKTGGGWGIGPTKKEAEAGAMHSCNGACTIAATDCN